MRALQQVVLNADGKMRTSLASGQAEKADHEFRKVAVALSKTRMLYAEAQRCDSDGLGTLGDTFIDVFGGDDDFLPTDDPLDILGTDVPIDTLTTPTLSPFGG